tara:strand:+ start:579 stop:770 length:192 start_codon:yes stop_codon:yes gene_type:complete
MKTVLEQYKDVFKNLRTETVTDGKTIKLYVWSPSLLSETITKDVLIFRLDGTEIYKEPTINLF